MSLRGLPMELAIRREGLVKKYPDVVAVNALDLEVRRGECLASSARGHSAFAQLAKDRRTVLPLSRLNDPQPAQDSPRNRRIYVAALWS